MSVSTSNDLAIIAFDGSAPAQHAVEQASRLLSARRVIVVTVWEEGLALVVPSTGLGAIAAAPINLTVVDEIDDAAQQHADRVAHEGAQLAHSLGLAAEPLAVADAGGVGETILASRETETPW